MPAFKLTTTTAALAGLLFSAPAMATFTNSCRNICIASDSSNILVTECLISGGNNGNPNDQQYQWAELDLNKILGYRSPEFLTYTENGDFSVNNVPCFLCSMSGSTIDCTCSGGKVSADLNTYIDDATGVLCFADDQFGPICGVPSSRTC
ncbi:hypothetical protein SPBR_05341 [Sporothrix brasiliensis 5110]|uniref:Cyanovirin-N domain-containing protein n=1 Tax=Sporothrix brasiliensis 5110 TaxID=1398154 RepID=A0A0C2F8D4_9PEZI|nr:uncharacterized protein SPBR_05341 [Sporothrix brasiliensis 5110]KIH87308.1 hypothetical protein SPBR_05341 [Sporothrix brasiliensis 5110]